MELRYPVISAILLVPCFWQSRIQAGDLASHIYNAWLAQLIARGQAPGLSIAPIKTNVLFDLVLSGLWRLGPAAAQRIAVSAAVLIFAWGAFTLASVIARGKPWSLLPVIAMLAYGFVFHAGFFNFYLSLGLCLWALALLWRPNPVRVSAAILILAVASVAHALPVGWTAGAVAYTSLARFLRPRYRLPLLAFSIGLLFLLSGLLAHSFPTHWFGYQVTLVTGADQLWVFRDRFRLLHLALAVIWTLMLARACGRRGIRLVLSPPFQVGALTAAVVVIIPASILLPGYAFPLNFIADRMSLCVAVSASVVLAALPPRKFETAALAALAVVFFGMVYMNERTMNRLEDGLEQAVATLPPGQRVLSSIHDPYTRVDPFVHLIDRACIGRCFSYANYEASTRQFRIRAAAGNPIVAASNPDSFSMAAGGYQIKERELPIYLVYPSAAPLGTFAVRPLHAGEPVPTAELFK